MRVPSRATTRPRISFHSPGPRAGERSRVRLKLIPQNAVIRIDAVKNAAFSDRRIVLEWITEKFAPADDSLASEGGIRAFLDAIPMAKPARALDDIGERFAGAAELEFDPAACRRALKRLDDAAQEPLAQVWDGIFSDSLGKSIADGPWNALVNYQRNVFCGYAYCLEQLPAPDKLDAAQRQDALVLANRAMTALVAHKALMRVRYRDPHPAFWTDSHALLTRALRYGIAQDPAKLYPAAVHQTTVEREYICGLLLDVAPTGNLLPTQTHCLHLILRHLNEHYRLADGYTAQMPFYIDPAKGKPPQRWLVGLKPRPGVRFFGFGDAYAHLGMLRKAAHTGARLPEWVGQSRIDAERYRALLDMLMEHWSANPPQRRKRRDRQVAAILVTHGLRQVHRMLAYSKFAKEGKQINYAENTCHDPAVFKAQLFGSVAQSKPAATTAQPATPVEVLQQFELAGDREMTERWSVMDTSEGGLGAVAEQHRGWLRAGLLVGFRYHDSSEWQVATVRRIGRTPQGKLGVGLKCQADVTGCARLRLDNANENDIWIAAGTGVDPYADAIVIGGEQPMLIVASGTYAPDRVCVMTAENSKQKIRFGRLVERGVDFEYIAFTPVAQA